MALLRSRMINTTKAPNHKTLISHEQTFRHFSLAEQLNDWWSAVIQQNGKAPVTGWDLEYANFQEKICLELMLSHNLWF